MIYRVLTLIFIAYLFLGDGKIAYTQSSPNFEEMFFGDIRRSSSYVMGLEKLENNELLCIQSKSSLVNLFSRRKSKYTFSIIHGLNFEQTRSLKLKGEGKFTNFLNYAPLGNLVLGLSYSKSNFQREPALFYHYINPKYKGKTNYGQLLFEPSNEISKSDLSRVFMVGSPQKKYAAVLYLPYTKSGTFSVVKYAIFNSSMAAPTQGEFILPFSSGNYDAIDYTILNESKQILVVGHYTSKSKGRGWEKDHSYYDYLTIHFIRGGEILSKTIEVPSVLFTDVYVYEQGESIIVSGLYATDRSGDEAGIFFIEATPDGLIKRQVFSLFGEELKSLISSFKSKFSPDPKYSDIVSDKFKVLDFKSIDSGYVLVSEFNATENRYSGSNIPGTINSLNTYYWSGYLWVTKLNFEGEIEWSKVIPKVQRTINDGGYYLSTAVYIGENYTHLFFNDNLSNYDKENNYVIFDRYPEFAKLNSSKNTIAHVSVNNGNGVVQRKATLGKSETQIVLVPKLSIAYYDTGHLIIYGRNGKKHRLGNINFTH